MAVFFTIRNIQLIRYVVCLVIARPLQHALPLARTNSGSVSRSRVARGSKKNGVILGTESCGVKVSEKCDSVRALVVLWAGCG